MKEEMVRAHLYISGRVQGVFFRSNMRRVAQENGVKGWVMNLPDGRVEAVLEGPKSAVLKVIKWARKGPPLAYVTDLQVIWEKYKGEFKDFKIKYY